MMPRTLQTVDLSIKFNTQNEVFQNWSTFLALHFVSIQFLHMFLYIVTSTRHSVDKKKIATRKALGSFFEREGGGGEAQ